jgi:glycerol-3-phosphate dehydrogenase (NAD(P)+)
MGHPAQGIRQNARMASSHLPKSAIMVSLAKGLEANTGKRISEIIAEEVPPELKERICVLSGPNLSQEIRRDLPATTIIASRDSGVASYVQKLIDSDLFYVFTSTDIVGVELCGALKNVIALGAGMTDGLNLGDNAKSAFITLGWKDVLSLGLAMGAENATIYGLAGLGDVLATSASNLSRNHHVGFEVAKGRKVDEVLSSMENVAEGVDTTMAVSLLSRKYRVNTPVLDMVNKLLFNPMPATDMIRLFKDVLKSGRL